MRVTQLTRFMHPTDGLGRPGPEFWLLSIVCLVLAGFRPGAAAEPPAVNPSPPASRATAPARRPSPPNILFLLGDDWRWDTLGCAGNPVVKTPNLDALAAEGVRFTHMQVTTSICCVSR